MRWNLTVVAAAQPAPHAVMESGMVMRLQLIVEDRALSVFPVLMAYRMAMRLVWTVGVAACPVLR